MKYYLDTEFSEYAFRINPLGGDLLPPHPDYSTHLDTIQLISIALVAEDGREYYAESLDFDLGRCNPWVQEHVLLRLGPPAQRKLRSTIRDEICAFVGDDQDPKFVGYFADYDWVVFCWLYGRMVDLPSHFPMHCLDVKQFLIAHGLSRDWLPPPPEDAHHALADARWIQEAHRRLMVLDGARQNIARMSEILLDAMAIAQVFPADPRSEKPGLVQECSRGLEEALRLYGSLRSSWSPEVPTS